MAPASKQHRARTQSIDHAPMLSRSVSTNSSHLGPLRPKSRGSTASLQSVGVGNAFQPVQPSQEHGSIIDQQAYFPGNYSHIQPLPPVPQDVTGLGPYQQMSNVRVPLPAEVAMHLQQQHDMRPMSRQAYHHDMQQMPIQYSNNVHPFNNMPPQHAHHMRHASEQYEGSPAPEDSSNENGGGKKRRGTASSMANDQELRRLLAQYQGRTLSDVAAEVQRNEGSGGKSEKAKQVFAMLWLRETCVRSTNSVRRDRVFARYTERCGNERVPTLNPASFGKLVRIIFPNVQTRRLGVRGESKYHYVDLSLVPDENDQGFDTFDRPSTSQGIIPDRPHSSASTHRPSNGNHRSISLNTLPPRMAMEIAEFPAPSISNTARIPQGRNRRVVETAVTKLDCQYVNTPLVNISKHNMSPSLIGALPAVRTNLPGSLSSYLAMPSENTLSQPTPSSQESPIELPDIHEFLANTSYDPQLAKLLHDLYRSYCIDVIDAFRKCKDKSFFNHHSAFNGKMTVPVSKLFTMECVAPWIQECDMRMYKQILRYMTQLVVQAVPEAVWGSFERIGSKLVPHIVASFEEKCPIHVVVAKVVPAARFTTLLKKLQFAQAATVSASRVFEQPTVSTQMWLDLLSCVDPDTLLTESMPPPESLSIIQGLLKHDLRAVLAPVADSLVPIAEQDPNSFYAAFFRDSAYVEGVLTDAQSLPHDIISRSVLWLENLPRAFEGHHPQCMIDWQTRFFRSISIQLANSPNCMSYHAWFAMENFAHQMLSFMTQLEGFLLSSDEQKKIDLKDLEKKAQDTKTRQSDGQILASPIDMREMNATAGIKRRRSMTDVGDEGRQRKSPSLQPHTGPEDSNIEPKSAASSFSNAVHDLNLNLAPPTHIHSAELAAIPQINTPQHDEHEHEIAMLDDHDDMAEINGPTLDLPTFRTGFTSPMKPLHDISPLKRGSHLKNTPQHDDSGIGMSMLGGNHNEDIEDETNLSGDKSAKKFNNRDWFLSSDPVVPVGHSVAA